MGARSIVIFADGAAKGNPGPGGWGALIFTPGDQVVELGGGSPHTTNNRMELTAVIEALTAIQDVAGPVAVYTDSAYVMQGITQWIRRWKQRGWETAEGTPVLNRDLWEMLDVVVGARARGHPVSWHLVRGHSGIAGNERVDAIADAFATGRRAELYRGPGSTYSVPIFPLPADAKQPRHSSGKRARPPKTPYSYLSLVDGEVTRHPTWSECERRVKGRSGARFKKAMSAEDEAEILRSWGLATKVPRTSG